MIGMSRPIVTLDGYPLNGASSYRGIGTYVREVLARLAVRDDLVVRALVTDPAVLPPGVVPVPIRRWAPGRFQAREHDLRLPGDLRRAGGDVVWSPAQDPPRRPHAPFVQTLLDVTPLVVVHPEHAAGAERLRRLAPRFRAAAGWIAISAYTADTCAEALDLPRDRIEVAHLAADARFGPPPDRRHRPGGDRPYVLYVGEYGAHKGFAEAFAVAAGLAAAGLPHRVRMVGRLAPWWRPTVEGLLAASLRPERVDLAGFVDDLVAEYHGADALIMTSRHEGFGLPIVEAMACGVPVVSFANSSLTEVVGDGGALVPDGDVDAMIEALGPVLTADSAWASASARSLARASAFDWTTTASRHAEVLLAAAQR
jgi:glycosyltransferase involved in cell wall biosynthesis